MTGFDLSTGDTTSGPLGSFYAFDQACTCGVDVGTQDVNGDGMADVVTAAGPGGRPQVTVFDGMTGSELFSFLAGDPLFTGGVSVTF